MTFSGFFVTPSVFEDQVINGGYSVEVVVISGSGISASAIGLMVSFSVTTCSIVSVVVSFNDSVGVVSIGDSVVVILSTFSVTASVVKKVVSGINSVVSTVFSVVTTFSVVVVVVVDAVVSSSLGSSLVVDT